MVSPTLKTIPLLTIKNGELGEDEKPSYECKTCRQLFFSYNDVVLHKGMTGHGEFTQRAKRSADKS